MANEEVTTYSTGVFVIAVYLIKLVLLMKKNTTSRKEPELGKPLREREFDLDEQSVFCNSGTYSCVPRRLVHRQIQLIKEREWNPFRWFKTTHHELLEGSLNAVAQLVGAKKENLTLIDNTTTATNVILKNHKYFPGDKFLVVNQHTYPAVWKQVEVIARETPGVGIVDINIPFPIRSKDDVIASYAKALKENPGIKIAIVDHITSNTVTQMPLQELIDLCHLHDVIVVVDGAHAPGQLQLRVEEYGADYYVGNLCKWLMTPRGVAFLWVHPKHQSTLRPLVTSHMEYMDNFRERFYSFMTRDLIPHFLVKDAIEFHKELGGIDVIVPRSTGILTKAVDMLSKSWHTRELGICPELRAPCMRMLSFPSELNEIYNYSDPGFCRELSEDLCEEGIHVKSFYFDEKIWCRISCNVWNDMDDFEKVRDVILKFVREKKERIKQRTLMQ